MRIFILEDDLNRIKWMKLHFDSRIDLDITDDVDVAMKYLKEEEYDIIFLDHDLGGRQMVSSSERDTGYTIAKMIHTTKNRGLTVIVHSWNPEGARNMMEAMQENDINCVYSYFSGPEFIKIVKQVNEQVS